MSDIAAECRQATAPRARANNAASEPKYQRVLDAFTEAIRRGDFKPGERIPAESALCAQLSMSLGTVQKALGKLVEMRTGGAQSAHRHVRCGPAARRHRSLGLSLSRCTDRRAADAVRASAERRGRSLARSRGVTCSARRSLRPGRSPVVDQERPAGVHERVLRIRARSRAARYADRGAAWLIGASLDGGPLQSPHAAHRTPHRLPRSSASTRARRCACPSGTIGTVWDVSDFSIARPGDPVPAAAAAARATGRSRSARAFGSYRADRPRVAARSAAGVCSQPRHPGFTPCRSWGWFSSS